MSDIGGALEHLSMASVADKDTVSIPTEAVKALTQNNASITTQLRDSTKLNLDMDKKLNLKPIQELEEKYWQKKAKKKA